MPFFVYVLGNNKKSKLTTYVGYTKNLKKRLIQHNISRGAKYTRGKKWIVFHKEIYNSKSKAMAREYQLKKDRKFRNTLREKFKKIKKDNLFFKSRLQ